MRDHPGGSCIGCAAVRGAQFNSTRVCESWGCCVFGDRTSNIKQPTPSIAGRAREASYQSNRFCGPIQGDMKTKKPEDRRRKTEVGSRRAEAAGGSPSSEDRRQKAQGRRPAAVGYLSRFLCVGFALALLATGCVGPRLLKGGKGVTTHKPAGVSEQTLVQSENPSQATKQDQETVKVRTYTVPADSLVEQSSAAGAPSGSSQLSTINSQPSPAFLLSSPMPVVEREETRARTELGARRRTRRGSWEPNRASRPVTIPWSRRDAINQGRFHSGQAFFRAPARPFHWD